MGTAIVIQLKEEAKIYAWVRSNTLYTMYVFNNTSDNTIVDFTGDDIYYLF